MLNNNQAMQAVFKALYDEGYMLQKRKENSFFLIKISETKSVSKYEIWDNGNDCICVGRWTECYDYQSGIDEMVELVLSHASVLG